MQNLVGKFHPFNDDTPLDGIFTFLNQKFKNPSYSIFTKTNEYSPYPPEALTYRNITEPFYFYTAENHYDIIFAFSFPVLITKYSLGNAPQTGIYTHTYPTQWKLSGSNNNSTFHEIDSQANQKFCSQITCETVKILSYSVKNANYYSYIKLTSEANSVDYKYLILSQIEFFGETKFPKICTVLQRSIKARFAYIILTLS